MVKLKRILIIAALAVSMHAGTAAGADAGQEIIVSAAASLTNAFTEIGKGFEAENPGVRVLFNFAASGALLQQIVQGAPVDVFASADMETMDKAVQKKVVDASAVSKFAVNRLVMVAPKGPAVKGLKDLGGSAVRRIALGRPEVVPAGRYTKEALVNAGMWDALLPKFIYAESVRQVLDYVSRGEVDAGFVYATDAAAASGKVRSVCEVGGHNPVVYPIAAVEHGKNPAAARKFIEYALGGKGRAVLARYGFARP